MAEEVVLVLRVPDLEVVEPADCLACDSSVVGEVAGIGTEEAEVLMAGVVNGHPEISIPARRD